jgi:hypothetical protein
MDQHPSRTLGGAKGGGQLGSDQPDPVGEEECGPLPLGQSAQGALDRVLFHRIGDRRRGQILRVDQHRASGPTPEVVEVHGSGDREEPGPGTASAVPAQCPGSPDEGVLHQVLRPGSIPAK